MAPKKRLPRRNKTTDGHPNLEEAAAERIDAVTAEPLHPLRFVEILSPDGTLRLFYNTATLIRIATDRGMFMQPPHFREPMLPSLQRQVEEIEGRTFRFEKSNVLIRDIGDENAGGIHVLHRHVYFDQIMDEFYLLNPAELYVCPACYLHWIGARLIPHLTETRQRIEYVDGDPNPVIDPLDVFAHMQGVQNAAENEADASHAADVSAEVERVPLTIPSMDVVPNWDSPLVHIVFRRAISWRRHVRRHHSDTGTAAVDYRLKEFLSQYISQYNRLLEEKNRKLRRRGDGASTGTPELTVPRYWHINARYNRLRYNRIVEAVERAEPHLDECVNQTAFPNETVMNTFHSNDQDSSASDFICDSDSSSESSGSSYSQFSRHEQRSPDPYGEADADETQESRKRRRESSSPTTSASSTSSSLQEEAEEEESRAKQRRWLKTGLLAPLPEPYRELTYEERRVLDAHAKRVVKPTLLYVPPQEGESEDDSEEEDVDWGQIGETIESAAVYVRDMQQRHTNTTTTTTTTNTTSTPADQRGGKTSSKECSATGKRMTDAPSTACAVQRLMLDDDSLPPHDHGAPKLLCAWPTKTSSFG
ncbi:uncharacterized protein Tco025E_06433 [Trypanosoma conorhini]|uniref:Uncharacterized protein n=1 Tax=Trypanosoma conorhini TaxID=83891 RepID=A0A3R7MBZ1_9TRYP|nr:uncharacterized protein Tco025E_06433 [Trypanosoma conorhini]RNF12583.1 hypothetical protein Tco025E_06433 [Trypanosoma conorhini]